jgi:hypothetical protein
MAMEERPWLTHYNSKQCPIKTAMSYVRRDVAWHGRRYVASQTFIISINLFELICDGY